METLSDDVLGHLLSIAVSMNGDIEQSGAVFRTCALVCKRWWRLISSHEAAKLLRDEFDHGWSFVDMPGRVPERRVAIALLGPSSSGKSTYQQTLWAKGVYPEFLVSAHDAAEMTLCHRRIGDKPVSIQVWDSPSRMEQPDIRTRSCIIQESNLLFVFFDAQNPVDSLRTLRDTIFAEFCDYGYCIVLSTLR